MARLFTAVAMPVAVRRTLEAHLKVQLATVGGGLPGRTVAPGNWHVTLRFLGDTSENQREAFCQAMDEADLGPAFPLEFGRLGAFPRPSRGAVLWLGLADGAPAMSALASTVEAVAVGAGFAPERRRFHPHVTLSRLRPPADVTAIVEAVTASRARMTAARVVLYESHLGSGGPTYDVVAAWRLS